MSSKRKAAAPAVGEADHPDPKRRKLPVIENETPESTTQVGLAFVAQLKQARDKRNHLISTNFLNLPDKKQIPQYYQEILLPIAIDTIETKLKSHGYPTLTTLESDLKRMVSNAKSFNERTSDVFSDAEKIRKMVSNYMTKTNPAYKNGSGYTPFPTPLPGEAQNRVIARGNIVDGANEVDADGETDHEEIVEKPRRSVTLHGPSASNPVNRRRTSSTPAVQEAEDAGESFDGNTFQQAQEKIMTEMIQLTNDDGQYISGPFLNLPSRELRDYYRLIKHPVCLKGAQKLVRGIKGRDKPTGQSLFKSWEAFEDEINYIWENARAYNEDGSDIPKLAAGLEGYFKRRLEEAKKAVVEPAQPKVKLRLSAKSPDPTPKITLRFGQKTGIEGNTGVAVDSQALKRQQDLVKAGVNGQSSGLNNGGSSHTGLRNPFGGSSSVAGSTVVPTLNQLAQERHGSAASSPPATNGIKHETQSEKSPALATVQPRNGSNTSDEVIPSPDLAALTMPPPASITPRLPSNSPHPQMMTMSTHPPPIQNLSNPLDSRWRLPGKDASDALISNLHIATHPGLKMERHFHLDIPPSSTASQQSITINLPSTHYYLQITPTIASNLAHRQSKLFVTVNMQRLNPIPQKAEEVDARKPLYEGRVLPGVNRVEVEMIAGPPRGALKVGPGQDIELEKVTVFVNVLRG
ncbi:hypothetical protein MMC06_004898 [Schaereria dolodes]|nr:hypothetical protein [Schaereria dolodes]